MGPCLGTWRPLWSLAGLGPWPTNLVWHLLPQPRRPLRPVTVPAGQAGRPAGQAGRPAPCLPAGCFSLLPALAFPLALPPSSQMSLCASTWHVVLPSLTQGGVTWCPEGWLGNPATRLGLGSFFPYPKKKKNDHHHVRFQTSD